MYIGLKHTPYGRPEYWFEVPSLDAVIWSPGGEPLCARQGDTALWVTAEGWTPTAMTPWPVVALSWADFRAARLLPGAPAEAAAYAAEEAACDPGLPDARTLAHVFSVQPSALRLLADGEGTYGGGRHVIDGVAGLCAQADENGHRMVWFPWPSAALAATKERRCLEFLHAHRGRDGYCGIPGAVWATSALEDLEPLIAEGVCGPIGAQQASRVYPALSAHIREMGYTA